MHNLKYLVQHHLMHSATLFPDKTALVVDNKKYAYQEILNACLKMTMDFKNKSIMRGDRVVILTGNSYLTVIAFFSAMMCDAVPCIVDSDIKKESLDAIIDNINPRFIVNNTEQVQLAECDHPFIFSNTENDLAMIMHTSGSTGESKGVMLSHRNVMSAIDSIRSYLNLNQNDVILSVLPMHFDYGLYQLLLAFSLGATLVLEKNCLFPNLIAHQISRYHVTVLPCVPLLIQLFYMLSKNYHSHFSSIRMVTNTGENLSLKHIEKLKILFPNAEIFSMYGLTECKRCSYVPPAMLEKKSGSIGIPMPNLEMWIQDDNGNRLNAHCEGELVISGPTVMQGYWKNDAKTAEKIRIVNGKRILLSGDRALMDEDGYFYFKGRRDLMIKFKGAKLNTQAVIATILLLPDVDRCHIFLTVSDQDYSKLIVCVELSSDKINRDQLKINILKCFSAAQKPDELFFCYQFPSLSNGKLDKNQLEKMAMLELQCI